MEKQALDLSDLKYEVTKEGNVATIKVKDDGGNVYVNKAKEAGIEKKTLETVARFDEAYLNAAVEASAKEAEKVMVEDKDIKEAIITVPFGVQKSSKIHTYVNREKSYPIPGTDEKVTKTIIKPVVESHRYGITKKKRKELEAMLTKSILGIDLNDKDK